MLFQRFIPLSQYLLLDEVARKEGVSVQAMLDRKMNEWLEAASKATGQKESTPFTGK